ncbi:MAG: ABC transporter permease [Acetobacteraceae bacterium]|nr:ABC transporter permease [Acetobacteraceae bacterium]
MSHAITPIAPAREILVEFKASSSIAERNRLAVRDVVDGARLWRLAWTLGWLDIRLRYRGSMLGPFWLTLSTAIMISALGYLYAVLFHQNVADYLPFLALSQVLWAFLAALVSESCIAFTEPESIIRSVRMPYFVFAVRTLIRNVLVLAHNIVVIVGVDVIFSIWPGVHALLAIPGMLLWGLDALALTLLLGGFCARFRDVMPIVNSVMQIAFFITPVIWKPSQLGARGVAKLPLNPFFDLLEIVRAPLLGQTPSMVVWGAALGYSLFLCVLGWVFFARARSRLAYWI